MTDSIQVHLPLTETTFLILLSLVGEPRHGYAIMKDVETTSANRISLGTGTLYGALKRLLEQGLITRIETPDQDGRQRKDYALTELGRRVLSAETNRLKQITAAATLRLGREVSS